MKKLGFIILAVVLTLGIIGVGYAAWTQTLTVNGNAKAGTFDTQFTAVSTSGDANGVAAVNIDNSDSTGHSFGIDITNGYPNLTTDVTFSIKDPGTVPAKISGAFNITNATDVTVTNTGTIGDGTVIGTGTVSGGKLHIVLADGFPQGANENFTVTIPTAQQY